MWGDTSPSWTTNLIIAETWGIPPWEVDDAPAIWIMRFAELQRLRTKKWDHDRKE